MSDTMQSSNVVAKTKMEPIVEENELGMKKEAFELFQMCDHGKKGFVTIGDLTQLKLDLGFSSEQMEAVFAQLDKDGDGLLTPEEFELGLELFLGPPKCDSFDTNEDEDAAGSTNSLDCQTKRQEFRKNRGLTFTNSVDLEQILPSNMEVSELLQDQGAIQLWYQMQTEHPDMLPTFEEFLKSLASEHRRIQDEISTLHQSFNQKSNAYEKQICVLYEEMENQIQGEREKIHTKKLELEKQLRNELEDAVQTKDEDIQELLNRWLKATEELEIATEGKAATEHANNQLLQEKEQLEQQLEDYQTQLDGLRSQMSSSKDKDLPEKRERFRCALKLSERIAWEREALLKQLDLLRSINRRLQDERDEVASGRLYQMESTDDLFGLSTSDALNSMTTQLTSAGSRRGSLLSDYFGTQPRSQLPSDQSDQEDPNNNNNTSQCQFEKQIEIQTEKQNTIPTDNPTKIKTDTQITVQTEEQIEIQTKNTFTVDPAPEPVAAEFNFPSTNPFAPENMTSGDFSSDIDPFFGSVEPPLLFSNDDPLFGNSEPPFPDVDPLFGNVKKNDFDSVSYVNFSDPDIAIEATTYFTDPLDKRMPTLCLVHPNNHQSSEDESVRIFCPDLESLCRSKTSLEDAKFGTQVQPNGDASNLIEISATDASKQSAVTNEDTSATGLLVEKSAQLMSNTVPETLNIPQTVFKVIFIGDSGVGKTSLINRICGGQFSDKFCTTIGVDFRVRTVHLNNHQVVLQLWDTAGQERFRSLTSQYMRRSDGVLIVYDVNSETTFKNVSNWMSSIENLTEENLFITLVGNKADVSAAGRRKAVSTEYGARLAKGQNSLFFETSAKDGYGIEEMIMSVARRLQTKQVEEIENCVKLTSSTSSLNKTKKLCC